MRGVSSHRKGEVRPLGWNVGVLNGMSGAATKVTFVLGILETLLLQDC